MRVIIAGSRGIHDYAMVCEAVRRSGFPISRVVSGMAAGVDTLAVRYATENGLPCDRFPAEWRKCGCPRIARCNSRGFPCFSPAYLLPLPHARLVA
jgi:hypothetical protein